MTKIRGEKDGKCKKKTRRKEEINICPSRKKMEGGKEWRRNKDRFAGWISRDCEETIESHFGRERHKDYDTSEFFMER